MAEQTFTSGQILTAAQMTTLQTNIGLSYVTQVAMSTQSTSVNGCFTSQYRNYRVLITTNQFTSNCSLNMRFRDGGTDNTTATYKYALSNVSVTTGTGTLCGNGTTEITFAFAGSANGDTETAMDIFDPQTNSRTKGSSNFFGYDSANWWNRSGGIFFDATTQFDGFTIFASAGTVTGLIQVFGYRN